MFSVPSVIFSVPGLTVFSTSFKGQTETHMTLFSHVAFETSKYFAKEKLIYKDVFAMGVVLSRNYSLRALAFVSILVFQLWI